MKVYIYTSFKLSPIEGRREKKCFADLQKACDYAIGDMLARFHDIVYSGNAEWVEYDGEKKYKIYFTDITGKGMICDCAYIVEYEVLD